MTTIARRDGDSWVIDGSKTWISNGGIADFYCVFARAAGTTGTRGISAFLVPANAPGLVIAERIDVIAPHPLARLAFDGCRVPADALIGAEGEGFKLAMRTLDVFRASVAAAALGFARRALDEALRHVGRTPDVRHDARRPAADAGDARRDGDGDRCGRAAHLPRRVAARYPGASATREAAMAKMAATETAQRVIDAAVQLFGGARRHPRRSRSSACTARFARCASTKARPRCRSSSSRGSC